ncbi:M20 family metallopeptidase [Robbsia sp. KACC 23696]|uniref:M20 family metallopeptidase n=1 Tax=Robbsia sp. KACC 23696 TaxID=3149231 RepID=UPI00325A67DD
MNRAAAVQQATDHFDSGAFLADLRRRVAFTTESQNPDNAPALHAYLRAEMMPTLAALGFTSEVVDNPVAGGPPFLIAHRHEGDDLPTVLTYGHGDVVRGYADQWRKGLAPWEVCIEGDRWYGRGTADNKGQHSVNFAALAAVLATRGGTLGFNVKVIFETGEEVSSPGLDAVCAARRDLLAADLFLASDGPRVSAERPTVFLGSRGGISFELSIDLRDGGHHSGNWGGALRNPAIVLSHAIASMVDRHGAIAVSGLRPPAIPASVRHALEDIVLGGDENAPEVDPNWGEPGLTTTERVIAWNTLEVLAMTSGNPEAPVNAIPPRAKAACQLRFVVGTDWEHAGEHLRNHFAAHGFPEVQVTMGSTSRATRLDPDDAWVHWALDSMRQTTGKKPALLPNLGGTVPNDVFATTLGLPTLWVPHSYPACAQHAPNEHLLGSVAREGLQTMAGLWWDLAEAGPAIIATRAATRHTASSVTRSAP